MSISQIMSQIFDVKARYSIICLDSLSMCRVRVHASEKRIGEYLKDCTCMKSLADNLLVTYKYRNE